MIRYVKTNNIYRGALCASKTEYPFLKGFEFFLADAESDEWYSKYDKMRCIILRIVGASRDNEHSFNDDIYSCCVNKRVMFFI